jgi:two-component system response regulator RegX3
MSRILVVEDEQAIADAVTYALEEAGYDVDAVGSGDLALDAARGRDYDLMILDLMLPGTPGLEVCRMLRAESDLPLVKLSAADAEVDRVEGLECGADDYVTKPFSVAELVSRVRALLRRRLLDRTSASITRRLGELEVDLNRHTVTMSGRPLPLTRSEFRLVALLSSEPGRAFSREELVRHLWQSEFVGDRRSIDVHISNLRRKLEGDPRNPRTLLTVRGVGYKLVAD